MYALLCMFTHKVNVVFEKIIILLECNGPPTIAKVYSLSYKHTHVNSEMMYMYFKAWSNNYETGSKSQQALNTRQQVQSIQ